MGVCTSIHLVLVNRPSFPENSYQMLFFLFWLLMLFLPSIVVFPASPTPSADPCKFGECERWNILLVPLLTEQFSQVALLKAIIRAMLVGCRWYFPEQIHIELFTRNNTFLLIKDPISLPELDQFLDQLKYSSTTTSQRQEGVDQEWKQAIKMAVDRMNGTEGAQQEEAREEESASEETEHSSSSEEEEAADSQRDHRGRFIFVVTDFDQTKSGHGSEFLDELDRELAESNIMLRNVRLQFDGHKHTQIIPGGGGQSPLRQDISNISSNIVRVAIVEPGVDFDAFAAIRPCAPLSDEEKIREYSYVQHFYYENWFLRNPRGALIGFGLFICAIVCAISAYFFHLWEQARAKRKAQLLQQPAAAEGQ